MNDARGLRLVATVFVECGTMYAQTGPAYLRSTGGCESERAARGSTVVPVCGWGSWEMAATTGTQEADA
jgi:hypothetical protein|eukprot:COSAG01_NODE_3116_length_6565_cov_2.533406_3_plen_69_part_00